MRQQLPIGFNHGLVMRSKSGFTRPWNLVLCDWQSHSKMIANRSTKAERTTQTGSNGSRRSPMSAKILFAWSR